MTQLPSAYVEGYEKARALDPDLADAYVENTLGGDPLADAAIASLTELDGAQSHRLIDAAMEYDQEGLREAPDALKEFFSALDRPPPFELNPGKAAMGARFFYKHSDLFFATMVLDSLVTGLTEGLSKAFYITERTTGNQRRLRQNARHVAEITLPGGLQRQGDGWKLTIRIRLIHAQVRRLLLDSDEWDVSVDGTPLHMAHMALGATGFSAMNLRSLRKLGVKPTEEESAGFMHIWAYVSWLLGIPEKLLAHTEEQGAHLRRVAHLCEPPIGAKAITVAHGYIKILPELAGVTEPAKQKRLLSFLFRISRALIGNELADRLGYPKQITLGALALARAQRRFQIIYSRIMPGATPFAATNFIGMMERSVYDDVGINYRMPDAVKDAESSPW